MQTIRQVTPNELRFMVHTTPVKNTNGRPKKYRGLPVYSSCNHVEHGRVEPHPESFMYVVVGERGDV